MSLAGGKPAWHRSTGYCIHCKAYGPGRWHKTVDERLELVECQRCLDAGRGRKR